MPIWIFKESIVSVLLLFWNQRIVGSVSLEKNQNQNQNERNIDPGYFKNLKELEIFMKEPIKNC